MTTLRPGSRPLGGTLKENLPAYLEEAGLEGLVVLGPATHNPNMTYFTGPVHVGMGVLVVPRASEPVLYCADMERDEAARSGLQWRPLDVRGYAEAAGGDRRAILAVGLEQILSQHGMTGRIAVAGRQEAGETVETFRRLRDRLPGLEVVAVEDHRAPLALARATKAPVEVDRIRRMGALTTQVASWTVDFLTSHRERHGLLVDRDGNPLTIGDVKRRVNLWLAEGGAEVPEGLILAVGRDAGVPHSAGVDSQPIPIGQAILFDLFPCEAGGGYCYDFTRTWCLDHAPEPIARAHHDVLEAYQMASGSTLPGANAQALQRAVCEFFEARGHPTVLSTPRTTEGYVHSLGHGLGLAVHESPFFRLPPMPAETLEAGNVVTIEPGLYYPERGFGVRLEDTLWIGPQGAEVLAPFPMDLVLPLRTGNDDR